jgi:hypothetical protein
MKTIARCIAMLAWLLLSVLTALAAPYIGLRTDVSCAVVSVDGLGGWSRADQDRWVRDITPFISDRASHFLESSEDAPAMYPLNGNSISITSADWVRTVTGTNSVSKVITGNVGDAIPTYSRVKSGSRRVREVITGEEIAVTLPIRPRDLKPGQHKTIVMSVSCERRR